MDEQTEVSELENAGNRTCPDVQILVKAFRELQVGDTMTYDDCLDRYKINIRPGEAGYSAFTRARPDLVRDFHIILHNEKGVGYTKCPPGMADRESSTDYVKVGRKVIKAIQVHAAVPIEKLSVDEQNSHTVRSSILGIQHMAASPPMEKKLVGSVKTGTLKSDMGGIMGLLGS